VPQAAVSDSSGAMMSAVGCGGTNWDKIAFRIRFGNMGLFHNSVEMCEDLECDGEISLLISVRTERARDPSS
jgi:hypothetical protein